MLSKSFRSLGIKGEGVEGSVATRLISQTGSHSAFMQPLGLGNFVVCGLAVRSVDERHVLPLDSCVAVVGMGYGEPFSRSSFMGAGNSARRFSGCCCLQVWLLKFKE